jgi:pimeloyl-ACP methyl ester carboxylesterase
MNGETNFKHDYAQIGGVRLHYVTAGEGEKLVILLHGFPEFWYSWRHQIEALSNEYTVVAPDMRGYNLSDKPSNVSDYRIENSVDDLTGLIRHFGQENAAIVGHDWGAGVAWATALRHPEYVWKLCAMQVPPISVWRKNQSLRQALASSYMLFFQIPYLPEWFMSLNDFAALEKTLKTTTAADGFFTDEIIAEYKKSWREDNALTSAINYYRANILRLFLRRQSDSENKIKVPTLFIYGEKDFAILPETVREVSQAIDEPFSEFRIPNAGHWVQQEAASDVNQVLLDFLAD